MKRPGLKKASKRQSLHQKYKITKRINQHNRKQKKLLKKGQTPGQASRFTKRTRDPGIPSNCPFSDLILKEAQENKLLAEQEKEDMKIRQKNWQQLQNKRKSLGFKSVEEMLEKTKQDQKDFSEKQAEASLVENASNGLQNHKGKRESQAFWRQVSSVINDADVILHVLDARDPEGTRCKNIEQAVAANPDKRLVLVLNKIDLIPMESVKAWLKYYRKVVGPCLAFRATTQAQNKNLSQKGSAGKIDKSSAGTQALLSYLANYGRMESADKTSKIRTAVTVGIVGMPNVGKSSIINTLKRNRSCKVGGEPGVTRNLQIVQVDTNVKLIDSPGVVIQDQKKSSGKILLNTMAGRVDDNRDAAIEILKRCGDMRKLAFTYQLEISESVVTDTDYFLAALARRKGFLKKGAKPDLNHACRFLVKEWTSGKLAFHTMPPESATSGSSKDELKTSLGEELDEEMLFLGSSGESNSMSDAPNVLLNIVENKPDIVPTEYKVDIPSRKRKPDMDSMVESDNEEEMEHVETVNTDSMNVSWADNPAKFMKKRKKQIKKSNKKMSAVADEMTEVMKLL